MGFMSRSSSRSHYKNPHHGGHYYQKKGILGNIFDVIVSRSHSHNYKHDFNVNNNNFSTQQIGINCKKCNAQIPTGSKFCLQCGEKVSEGVFCGNCGEKLPNDAKFCHKCGNKINL